MNFTQVFAFKTGQDNHHYIMIKSALRTLAGLAILAVGIFAMNGLIGMKETPPVKPRPATARVVKAMSAEPDTLVPSVGIEGRV